MVSRCAFAIGQNPSGWIKSWWNIFEVPYLFTRQTSQVISFERGPEGNSLVIRGFCTCGYHEAHENRCKHLGLILHMESGHIRDGYWRVPKSEEMAKANLPPEGVHHAGSLDGDLAEPPRDVLIRPLAGPLEAPRRAWVRG